MCEPERTSWLCNFISIFIEAAVKKKSLSLASELIVFDLEVTGMQ